jgi:hypothetical protein
MIDRWKQWAHTIKRDAHALYLATRDPRVPWYAAAFTTMWKIWQRGDLIGDNIIDEIDAHGAGKKSVWMACAQFAFSGIKSDFGFDAHSERSAKNESATPIRHWRSSAAI